MLLIVDWYQSHFYIMICGRFIRVFFFYGCTYLNTYINMCYTDIRNFFLHFTLEARCISFKSCWREMRKNQWISGFEFTSPRNHLNEIAIEQMHSGVNFPPPKNTLHWAASNLELHKQISLWSRLILVVNYTISIPPRNDHSFCYFTNSKAGL